MVNTVLDGHIVIEFCGCIHRHPDGRYVYAVLRSHSFGFE
jgi:hypothetical protein